MANIAKPQVGKRGWNVAVDAAIDKVNAHDANLTSRLRPIAQNTHVLARGGAPENLSDGVSTGITTQLAHTATITAGGVRLAFANIYNNAGIDTPGPNDITVKANIRISGGLNYPVYFSGRRSAVIEPGAVVLSDPIGLSVNKNDVFYSRTYVSVTSGGKYPLGLKTSSDVEGVSAGDSADTTSGANATRSYGPWAVLGTPSAVTPSPVILTVGDSITAGYGDNVGTRDAWGWVRRALDGNLAYLNIGVASGNAGTSDTPNELANRMRFAELCTYDAAIVLFGTNDLTGGATLAALQARLTALWGILQARGMRVYGATIPPVTTSTDTWATTGNQAVVASNAVRVQINNWIRTTPSPLAGYYEFADAVESARDSGIWKASYTGDGTHPNTAGATAMAATITPAALGALL